ncbi:MAG TPA: alpha/beta hydrolase [Chloroflexaceae bacterium]|nr:alpha/beta hydrolase [Chloroflexaceae bacterium]
MRTTTRTPSWSPDLLDGFEAATIELPAAFDGPAVATLVRRPAPQPIGRAVLYLHGFVDYFFQAHMALAYNDHGYDFYALDLRRHGRSLRPHQRPNFCKDLREYYAEIDRALEIMAAAGHAWVLLNGHSTGGLTAALYAHEGARRAQVSALFLNSPFLDLNATPFQRAQAAVFAPLGAVAPTLNLGALISPLYAQSVHKAHRGEWEFDLGWKPIAGHPTYAGWLRAIVGGQRRVQAGLGLACPILLMHSARSHVGAVWGDDFTCADCVLDVEHMRRYGPGLGRDVTMVAVEGGLHDLVLSPPPVRERVFAELFAWLGRLP